MANKITVRGTVEKVALVNGKALAIITMTVPASQVLSIPLGSVSVDIQSLQTAMFAPREPMKLSRTK